LVGLSVVENDLSNETDDIDDGENKCYAFKGKMRCKNGM
jgi:hypothetical protein